MRTGSYPPDLNEYEKNKYDYIKYLVDEMKLDDKFMYNTSQ